MAQIDFYGLKPDGSSVAFAGPAAPATSGIGFYGASFGNSVQVDQYQASTHVTDGAGTTDVGHELNNLRPIESDATASPGSGVIFNGSTLVGASGLLRIPNASGTLNIRFSHGTQVQTQAVVAYITDRVNADPLAAASGVTCQMAELIHPSGDPGDEIGSGDATWITPSGETNPVPLQSGAGSGGLAPDGVLTSGLRHDWFLAIAASPKTIGSKTLFGLFVELQYL